MEDPSLLRIWLLSIFAEALFLGIFSVLYVIAIWILVYHRRNGWRSPRNICLSAIVTIMLLCATADLAFDIHQLLVAFVGYTTASGAPSGYLPALSVNDPAVYAPTSIFAFLTLLGDGFMAYRVYVVWDRQLISVAIPALLLAGDVVTTAIVGNALLKGDPTAYLDVIYIPGGRLPLAAYFSMTLLTNVVTALLLLGRLWWHDRRVKKYLPHDAHGSVSWRVMKTVMQSQAAYSTGVVFNLVTFLARSNLTLIANAILPSLIGISFTLIIARIGFSEALGRTSNASSADSNVSDLHNRARGPSPLAFNMFISQTQTNDGENVAVQGHTKPLSSMV